jgi:hypothetical protein
MNSTPLSLRSTWNDIEKLKAVCHLYALQKSFEFTTKCCDARRYAITCKGKSIEDASPCPWQLNACVSTQSVSYVTSIDENEVHTCSGLFDGKHPQVSARFLAQQFMHVPFTRFLILWSGCRTLSSWTPTLMTTLMTLTKIFLPPFLQTHVDRQDGLRINVTETLPSVMWINQRSYIAVVDAVGFGHNRKTCRNPI